MPPIEPPIELLSMDRFAVGARESLFFMHIPKTAGMSMRLYLSGQYPTGDVCPAARWQDILGREETLNTYGLLQGHFRYNVRTLLSDGTRMLVMLREPLRRTLSALRHLQRDPNFHRDHELAKNLTMSEILRHPRLMRTQKNVQARFLCASRPAAEVSADLVRAQASNADADAGDGEAPPTLQLAQDRLTSVDFIGLTEDIGTVLSGMARVMHYHPPLHFPRINEDPEHRDPLEGLSPEDLEILRMHNDVDLPLYEFAGRLIERRSFEQSMRDLVDSGTYQVPAGSFEIPITDIMPGSGWYAAEQEGGIPWRWTGPERYFTIELPLRPDASYRLYMSFGSAGPFGPGDLGARVNDVPVECEMAAEDAGYRCELAIARELLAPHQGFCCIRFDTGGTTLVNPEDNRPLGVAVRRLVFECLDE